MSDRSMMDLRYMADSKAIENAVERLEAIKAVEFKQLMAMDARMRYGLVGQTMRGVADQAVEVDGMGHHYVELDQLVPMLVSAVQELSARVKELESKRTKKPRAAEPAAQE